MLKYIWMKRCATGIICHKRSQTDGWSLLLVLIMATHGNMLAYWNCRSRLRRRPAKIGFQESNGPPRGWPSRCLESTEDMVIFRSFGNNKGNKNWEHRTPYLFLYNKGISRPPFVCVWTKKLVYASFAQSLSLRHTYKGMSTPKDKNLCEPWATTTS